jgi:GT2 family glycosyltransferase
MVLLSPADDAQAIASPQDGAKQRGPEWRALSQTPWLEIALEPRLRAARYLEIVYRASLFDDPVRPILRFVTRTGVRERLLPGPVAGAGIWRGPVPLGLERLLISPAARPGPFQFAVESIRRLNWRAAALDVWRRRPGKLAEIAAARLFGYRREAEQALLWSNGADPLARFDAWRARVTRPLDLEGFDAGRCDWSAGPTFLMVLDPGGAPDLARATEESAARQIYPRARLAADARQADLADADYIVALKAGDRLAPEALCLFAQAALEAPTFPAALYGDEIEEAPDGTGRPGFKPDWSPRLFAGNDYIGRAAAVSSALWREAGGPATSARIARALALAPQAPLHLRRFVLTRAAQSASPARVEAAPALPARAKSSLTSIIILTRDKPELIGPCLRSLQEKPAGAPFELIVVDNGTRDPQALRILADAERWPNAQVMRRPGPFNFSAFNNEALALARGDALIFLNNDTEALSDNWAALLTQNLHDADIGAVGPLLLFPDGRVQHCGVVVGIGEEAGHFEAFQAPQDPSWLGRRGFVHETSAVTGACLAVAREKFEAVGGFDAERLPIEFNDVDLCLRLGERGWRTLYTPDVVLVHKESASRGGARLRPLNVYDGERAWFCERWRQVLRDDPWHHPGFALYARAPALPATYA